MNQETSTIKENHPSTGWFTVYDARGNFLGSYRNLVVAKQVASKGIFSRK